eukprot:GDKI01030033.1.p1 GENE.GDKI01030033.1~~GDKI01030033.1.p1  ORF type:complete len:152 (-),score=43.21 GDKI01030033.1:16-471(-)
MAQLGRLRIPDTIFFCCDIQERFRAVIHQMPHVIHTGKIMAHASRIMEIPLLVTEQYPKALLKTVAEIPVEHGTVFEKTKFSMLTEEVTKHILSDELKDRKSVVLFGIETHVCVQQTALDLLQLGYNVHILTDGVSSQRPLDRATALRVCA